MAFTLEMRSYTIPDQFHVLKVMSAGGSLSPDSLLIAAPWGGWCPSSWSRTSCSSGFTLLAKIELGFDEHTSYAFKSPAKKKDRMKRGQ
ncbi:unnamed protein product [Sphagnum tenellum]